jgi:eukaryotic-like serine/threonine-protein kinase
MTATPLSTLVAEELVPESRTRETNACELEAAVSSQARTNEPSTFIDPIIGTVVGDKYRIERKIGEGAMGVVLAARHLGLDEDVAIKVMRPEVQGQEGTVARFAKEAKIAARIRSEHVAKVLDVGVMEPLGPFIVMEYLEGESLANLLERRIAQRRGSLPAPRVIEYVLQACEALAAAHAIGVTHRDVKPDNLFLTRHGGLETLKLLDFGISKVALTGASFGAAVATTTLSFVMGTPLYMSPEQLRSVPDIDARTDVWSLGAVMYELLSGQPPFDGESIPAICADILDASPAPLRCSPALAAVVMRCLEKDRARRFQSIAELAAALVPLAPGEARAYASRSSCILRSSALNLSVGPEVLAAARDSASRGQRFQNSALVAASTVLALSALGVAITLAKMHTRTETARPVAIAPAAAIPLQVVPSSEAPDTASGVRVAPLPVVPPAPSTREPAPRSSVPAPADIAQPAAPRRAMVTTRTSAVARSSANQQAVRSSRRNDGRQAGRVRLVDQGPRLRLVEPNAPPPAHGKKWQKP